MNIAVIGKSKLNASLKERFEQAGLSVAVLEDAGALNTLTGEPGNFTIRTAQGTVEAGFVVITEEVKACRANINVGGASDAQRLPWISLTEERKNQDYREKGKPIVFLLDHAGDSPAYLTRIALQKASRLARKKKNVIYLTRFVRTAEPGLEELYVQAREAGVNFIKYDSLQAAFVEDEDLFVLRAAGGIDEFEIETHALIVAESRADDPAADALMRSLRLKNFQGGVDNIDSYYLFPALTGRKGVFMLSGAPEEFSGEELAFYVRHIVSTLKSLESEQKDALYAMVDPAKCAYCYTCYRACRHGAMEPDPENSAMKCLPKSCDGCGICVAVCPAAAIELVGEKDRTKAAGGIKVFCCENSGEIALKRLAGDAILAGKNLSVESVPCGGRINAQALLAALHDCDSVLVLVCPDGACRHEEGNKRAMKQVERAKSLLRSVGKDENRVQAMQLSHAMPQALLDVMEEL